MTRIRMAKYAQCDSPQCVCAFQKLSKGWEDAVNPNVPLYDLPLKNADNIFHSTKPHKSIEEKYQVRRHSAYESFCVIDEDSTSIIQEPVLDSPEMFNPSNKLALMINKNIDLPSSREADAYNEIRWFYDKPAINRFEIAGLKEIISEEIEDFLTDWANLIDSAQAPNCISKDGDSFSREVYIILLDRFQLNTSTADPVLKLLYHELLCYAKKGPQKRAWGQLRAENSELILDVIDGCFKAPKFESLFI